MKNRSWPSSISIKDFAKKGLAVVGGGVVLYGVKKYLSDKRRM